MASWLSASVSNSNNQPADDGCLWTVRVQDPVYYGDEISWELRGPDGTVLLSGGSYDYDYFDEQTVASEGPVEFYISAIGEYNDNSAYYEVENENGVILAGTMYGGNEGTFSNLNCDDPALVEEQYSCIEQFSINEEIEEAWVFDPSISARLAFDIPVGDNGFSVYGLNLQLILEENQDPQDMYIDFTLLNDDNGKPGETIEGIGGTLLSAEEIGFYFDGVLYDLNVKFSQPIDLNANTRYWLEVSAEAELWVSGPYSGIGKGLAFSGDYTDFQWKVDPNSEFNYGLICNELDVNDINKINFSYYPNPVKDVLTINSHKAVKSVEVYNLSGQKVIGFGNLNNNRIDTHSLRAGTYILNFRMSFMLHQRRYYILTDLQPSGYQQLSSSLFLQSQFQIFRKIHLLFQSLSTRYALKLLALTSFLLPA